MLCFELSCPIVEFNHNQCNNVCVKPCLSLSQILNLRSGLIPDLN